MSNYSLAEVAQRTDGSDTSWIAVGGGLSFDENGKLKIDSGDANLSFRMYVNSFSGVAATAIDSTQITSVANKNEFTQRFENITACLNWIEANVSSSKGTTDIILETNITQGPIFVRPGLQTVRVYGNKAVYQRQMGISNTNPSFTESRKHITITSATGLNNVPVYCSSPCEFNLCVFNITVNSNQYAWYRCTGAGNIYDLLGCKFSINSPGLTVGNGFQVSEARLRIRPFQATWRTGLDRLDPLHQGSGYRLAALELDGARAYALFSIGSGGAFSLVEYQYHTYQSQASYTYDARVHFITNPEIWIFVYLEGASEFETNGACATRTPGTSITVHEAGIKAVAFCPILPQPTTPNGIIGGTLSWPVIPVSSNGTTPLAYSGTTNVDFRVKTGTSLTFTTTLDQISHYPA